MQNESQSSSSNDCYSTNEQYFLDICAFGEFDELKELLSTLNQNTKFDWEFTSNSGDNFVHMLAANNFPQIFVFLINHLTEIGLKQKIPTLINKQNSTGQTPLHYSVITDSKDMLLKLLQYGADPSIVNELNRTAMDEAEMIQKFQLAAILAPVTKQDLERLKSEFGTMNVCDQDSDEDQEEKEGKQKEQKEAEQKHDKKEEKQQ